MRHWLRDSINKSYWVYIKLYTFDDFKNLLLMLIIKDVTMACICSKKFLNAFKNTAPAQNSLPTSQMNLFLLMDDFCHNLRKNC